MTDFHHLACLLAAISALRGPLFQRASTVSENAISNTTRVLDMRIAPFPVAEYFQSNQDDRRKQGGITTAFSNVLRDLNAGTPLTLNQSVPKCGGYCTGRVKVWQTAFTAENTCADDHTGLRFQGRL